MHSAPTLAAESTLEWFGSTTYRLKSHGITLFLDAWLERPELPTLPRFLSIEEVDEADYILISHAHFDHLPGADRLAKRTGAVIIGNGESINVMRVAGVPEDQLVAAAGGERVPLFTAQQREAARMNLAMFSDPNSGGPRPLPAFPDPGRAPITVHIWPSLHCLMPQGHNNQIPEFIDTATEYTGSGSHTCTMDITRGMIQGLGRVVQEREIPESVPKVMMPVFMYLRNREKNKYSFFDGGQLMYNILLGSPVEKVLLWHAHLGGYEGILKGLDPKPDIAIMAIAGQANLNGRPFDGTAAQFALKEVKWIGEPEKVIWCLHDQGAIKPYYIRTAAATDTIEKETRSKVWDLEHARVYKLFA